MAVFILRFHWVSCLPLAGRVSRVSVGEKDDDKGRPLFLRETRGQFIGDAGTHFAPSGNMAERQKNFNRETARAMDLIWKQDKESELNQSASNALKQTFFIFARKFVLPYPQYAPALSSQGAINQKITRFI